MIEARRLQLIVCLAAFVVGCSGGSTSDNVIRRDSAGVMIVETSEVLDTARSPWMVGAVPTVSIGQADGPAEYEFHEITSAVRLSDGRIVVADGGYEAPIRYFSERGSLSKAVGRRGPGPEEFGGSLSVQFLGSDSVLVVDVDHRRTWVLTPEGQLISGAAYGKPNSPSVRSINRLADGRLAGIASSFPRWNGRPTPGIHRMQAALVVVDPENPPEAPPDTVATLAGEDFSLVEVDGRILTGIVPFGHSLGFAAVNQGFYVGDGEHLGIDLYSLEGQLLRSARARDLDLTLTDEEWTAFIDSTVADLPTGNAGVELRRFLDAIPRPAQKVAYTRIVLDPEGNVWLGPYETPFRSFGPWQVFDPSGRYLGPVATPSRLRILEIGHDHVLGQWRDELGVESVQVRRLTRH